MLEDDKDDELTPRPQRHSTLPWWVAALGVGLVILGGLTYFQNAEMKTLRQDVSQLGLSQAKENAALRAIFAKNDFDLQGVLRDFRSELVTTRQQSSEGVKHVQIVAARRAELIGGQIESRQNERAQQFTEELAKVRVSHDEASNKINSISTEVGAVKTEVETAKSSIQQTLADLQRTRGDLGVMSGLIATNSKEIQLLRELGDRDIFEFTLVKSAGLQQVGDVRLMLKKVDIGHNRYTVELLSDDKRVEKKDKSLNEPVQFYTSSRASKQPYELVVNEVKKNTITGYLARPKVIVAQARAK
jgi:hypothetical protein